MKVNFILGALFIIIVGCNSNDKKTDVKVSTKKEKQKEYFDRGTIEVNDTVGLKLIKDNVISKQTSDDSYRYLRKDNYFADQFSCVVHGWSYYRLTNIHPTKTISGCVKKSWIYNGETVYEYVSFTLKPKEWKTFGCFFVTPSQPISFEICSVYGLNQSCLCPQVE